MVNEFSTNLVKVVIFTPEPETYKSLSARVRTLPNPNQIAMEFAHAFTIADCKQFLKEYGNVGQRVFLCCDVADGREESADQIKVFFMDLWQDPQYLPHPWITTRPLLGMSVDPDIVDEMKRIVDRHPRKHSKIVTSLSTQGTNRWRDTRDALLIGVQNA